MMILIINRPAEVHRSCTSGTSEFFVTTLFIYMVIFSKMI